MNELKWVNPHQPQTLYMGVILCYIQGVFAILSYPTYGAWVFVISWPLEAAFLFVRGNHVPGSPTGATTTLVVASLLACEAVALWQVWRARRDSCALAN